MKPRLLDLFCGVGGATRGYQLAGFHVTGVDNKPQPNYCGDEFVEGDALEVDLDEFDAIHASPPCQHYCISLNAFANAQEIRDGHPDLVGPVRDRLKRVRAPWVIENVMGAPLRKSFVLCGEMFGLRIFRHRLFESSELILAPLHQPHRRKSFTQGLRPPSDEYVWTPTGHFAGTVEEVGAAMGITWAKKKPELANAIPPAYTKFIGESLIRAAVAA